MNALKENINNHYKVKIVGEAPAARGAAAAAGESQERWASPIRGRITCLEVNIPNEGHRRLRTSSSRVVCCTTAACTPHSTLMLHPSCDTRTSDCY